MPCPHPKCFTNGSNSPRAPRHKDETKIPDSGTTSDEENEDGDFTVYECPGLAPVSKNHRPEENHLWGLLVQEFLLFLN